MEINPSLDRSDFFSSAPPASASLASAQDYLVCRQVMQKASKNYSFASRFFPQDKLMHVEALYAFMRVGDDRVDVSHSGFLSALEAIEDWERAYWLAFERQDSPHPVMRAYLNTALLHKIPAEIMAPYFRAMKDDIALEPGEIKRFETFDELVEYMGGSAIPVGRAMTYILGVRPPYRITDALPGADSLSIAMQLSNFWRDIGQDWNIGRIYLPQEDMCLFGYSEGDLSRKHISPSFVNLLEFEFARTESYYEHARRYVPMLASGDWAVMSGLEIYRALLAAIRRNKYDVFKHRARASTVRKIVLAANAWYQTQRKSMDGDQVTP